MSKTQGRMEKERAEGKQTDRHRNKDRETDRQRHRDKETERNRERKRQEMARGRKRVREKDRGRQREHALSTTVIMLQQVWRRGSTAIYMSNPEYLLLSSVSPDTPAVPQSW